MLFSDFIHDILVVHCFLFYLTSVFNVKHFVTVFWKVLYCINEDYYYIIVIIITILRSSSSSCSSSSSWTSSNITFMGFVIKIKKKRGKKHEQLVRLVVNKPTVSPD